MQPIEYISLGIMGIAFLRCLFKLFYIHLGTSFLNIYLFICIHFQIGRSSESPIDFVVMDTVPGNKPTDKINTQSTISRFACRLLCNRDEGDLSAMIFAAGFDSSRNIFLGKKVNLDYRN